MVVWLWRCGGDEVAASTCGVCREKVANRPGRLCYACWLEAGKPTAKELRAKEKKDNAAVVYVPPAPRTRSGQELSDRVDGELAAMRWVTTHGPGDDETWEQRSARSFLESASAAFYARRAKLEEGEESKGRAVVPSGSGGIWDGVGECPGCGRGPEVALRDENADRIVGMLGRLAGRES